MFTKYYRVVPGTGIVPVPATFGYYQHNTLIPDSFISLLSTDTFVNTSWSRGLACARRYDSNFGSGCTLDPAFHWWESL